MIPMLPRSRWGAAFLALLVLPVSAVGQSLTRGSVAGSVHDEGGSPVHDVRILLVEQGTGVSREGRSSRTGEFRMAFAPTGEYDLLVERFGYRPLRMEGVSVRSGQRTVLRLTLSPAAPPVDSVEVIRLGAGALPGGDAGARQWFSWEMEAFPDARGELRELMRLSTVADSRSGVEGLPGWLGGSVVDGLPSATARHPGWNDEPRGSAPLAAFSQAALVTTDADVELPGWAAGYVAGHSAGGGREFRTRAVGGWGPAASGTHDALRGRAVVRGPIVSDTAHFLLGVHWNRAASPFEAAWRSGGDTDRLVAAAREVYGVGLEGFEREQAMDGEVLSAFGRVDWLLGGGHDLSVRGSFTTLPQTSSSLSAFHPQHEGRDVSVAATLTSRLSERLSQELRAGYETSLRDYGTDGFGTREGRLASTVVTETGLGFGSATGAGRFSTSVFRIVEALHLETGAHALKAGIAADVPSYDQTFAHARGGSFIFAGIDDFVDGTGHFRQSVGSLPVARFRVPLVAVFVQDTWSMAPGVTVTGGVRFETEHLPVGEIDTNDGWLRRTGLDNARLPSRLRRFSPRLGLVWTDPAGGWTAHATGGLYHNPFIPELLAEAMVGDGRVQGRAGVGSLGQWPELPSDEVAPVVGPTLSLLPEGLASPRTARATAGLSRSMGRATTLQLSGTFRRTELLPRRADLNLAVPGGADQHGRPIHGNLAHEQGLALAVPGSDRRFNGFDRVWGLNLDGYSEFRGATLALERRLGSGAALFARYTLSETLDNWVGAASGDPEAQLAPFSGLEGGDQWTEARSDFDVPHRAVVGAELRMPIPLAPRLSGVYRYRSGLPFTPGFRDGVDINADGSGRNDPAFLSDQVSGASELFARNDCLRTQLGGFAGRNSCRGEGVHALDARLTLDVVQSGRYTASVLIDGFDLLRSEEGIVDRAVYLVDRDIPGPDDSGVTTLPLRANPDFGSLLVRRAAVPALRVGVQLNF
jgi:hypothetical protein